MCKGARLSLVRVGATAAGPQASLGEVPQCPGMNGPLSLRLCEPLCVQVPLSRPQPHVERGGEARRSPNHSASF